LTTLQQEGKLAASALPLVVLLHSASDDVFPLLRRRHLEYGELTGTSSIWAQAHVDFVARIVRPLVDAKFQTLPDQSYVMGTSLGGQASMNLLLQYPDLFQGAACLSPFFGPSTIQCIQDNVDLFVSSSAPPHRSYYEDDSSGDIPKKKLYFDMGGDCLDQRVPLLDVWDHVNKPHHWWNPGYFLLDTYLQGPLQKVLQILQQHQVEFDYHQVPGARHNERAWSLRIDKPLLRLFGRDNDE
jgi:pimeloyl-ACP methyl ester carboxylesterase